ncbi:MAG: ABC transporter ATP-binding protein [Oscillospiraceae bacterium]|nr:ABC transporter ATP-binding protein [Oscillospiraceae bacterium]
MLLDVKNLSVCFDTYAGQVQAVRDVSFQVREGERLAVVGESGSGKSVMTQSFVSLLPSPPARIAGGQVVYLGEDILKYSFRQYRKIKGAEIAYVFQDPMTSLNPTSRIGAQVIEGLVSHRRMDRRAAKAFALELMKKVGIPSPERRLEQYPYELSGGMRQRVMIAIAIALTPRLLIADEPTTALDVTIQSQILHILKHLNQSAGMALLLITHDMGIVAGMAERMLVMYGGKIVESGPVQALFSGAHHPYTRALLASVPRLDKEQQGELQYIVGSPPDMLCPPAGCPFAPRCKFSMKACFTVMPEEAQTGPDHLVSCHLAHPGAAAVRARFESVYAGEVGDA